jgi:glutathione S-transferase
MLKLYGGKFSRATIVQWYLEELALPYEFVLVDLQAGEQHQQPYLDINPIGKVPAIADGDFQLWETGAILLYLLEKYGGQSFSLEQRSLFNQWILYANATMGPDVFSEATREKAFPRNMMMLNTLLSQQPYILGEEFTVADVAVGSLLGYIPLMLKLDFSNYPAVDGYCQRIAERPAFQKAMSPRHG